MDTSGFSKRFGASLNMSAALQLYITTKDKQYGAVFKNDVWQPLDRSISFAMMPALQAVPYMDDDYKKKLRNYAVKYLWCIYGTHSFQWQQNGLAGFGRIQYAIWNCL